MKKILTFVLFFIACNAFGLEGLYEGKIDFFDASLDDIRLQVSLSNNEEMISLPNGDERNVLDGSFVIGLEGGVFSFSQVQFNLENSWVEMTYKRPGALKPNLRFFGDLKSRDKIEGTVFSSMWGKIGVFHLKKSPRSLMAKKEVLLGTWQGHVVNGNGAEEIILSIGSRASNQVNPEDIELSYTRGKTGSLKKGDGEFSLNNVWIDYLRRKMILAMSSGNGYQLMLELKFNDSGNVLKGRMAGAMSETYSEIELTKVN